MTKTLPVAEVAQNFEAVLDSAAENGDEVLVEKEGRVVARLVPAPKPGGRTLEQMRGSGKILGDIVGPLDPGAAESSSRIRTPGSGGSHSRDSSRRQQQTQCPMALASRRSVAGKWPCSPINAVSSSISRRWSGFVKR